MKRVILLALIGLVPLLALSGQESILPTPPDQIETILELLDAVDAAQYVILETPEMVTGNDIKNLQDLVIVAETIGAEDLAARARTLIVLASFGEVAPPPELPPVEGGLQLSGDVPLARDTQTFRRWVNVGATAGATALGMSAIFYTFAERNYQEWLTEPDPTTRDQLYRAWRGYDYLAIGLGTATLLSVGVGMPLVFALTPPATTLATPPEAVTFTPARREAELQRLYAERVKIVDKINRLNTRERRRSLMRTISLGAGTAGAITAGTFYYAADQTYDRYLAATDSTEAETLSKRVSLFDALAVIGAGIGGGGFGFAATVGVITPNRSELERELERVNAAIIRIRASRTIDAPDPEPEPEKTDRRWFRRDRDDTPTETDESVTPTTGDAAEGSE